eukprot:937784-Prorocentrum_minimum.AAC.2
MLYHIGITSNTSPTRRPSPSSNSRIRTGSNFELGLGGMLTATGREVPESQSRVGRGNVHCKCYRRQHTLASSYPIGVARIEPGDIGYQEGGRLKVALCRETR